MLNNKFDFNDPMWALARSACESNDITLLEKAMSATSELEYLYDHVRTASIQNNSIKILSHLIERGMSVVYPPLRPDDVVGKGNTSKATLEFLLAHGWDINRRNTARTGTEAESFMLHVTKDVDMVAWRLEHGASVHPCYQEPLRDDILTVDQRRYGQVLERTAAEGSIATFELLRSRGAPLGWRSLHCAVEAATFSCPPRAGMKSEWVRMAGWSDKHDHVERMAMVRHLIDVVGLDVNASDQPVGQNLPMRNGPPICYISFPGDAIIMGRDVRELIWLLLDRGADPTPALEDAKLGSGEIPHFAEDVEAWKEQRNHHRKCCVQ